MSETEQTELQDLAFALFGFLPLSNVHIGMERAVFVFFLCHCTFKRYYLFSDFIRCGSHEISLNVKEFFGSLNISGLFVVNIEFRQIFS